MFALTLRFNSLSFATRSRVGLSLPLPPVTGLRVPSYATYSVTNLRSLGRDELINTLLLERGDWMHEMTAFKEQAFEHERRLKDQILATEGKLHVLLMASEAKVHALSMAAEARVTTEKVGLLLNERELQHRLLKAEVRSNATEARRNEASEARLKSEMELKLTKMRMRELQIALLRSQNRFNLRGIIESIAEQPDYDMALAPEEKVPSSKRGVQARIDWIIDNSPAYNSFREKIIIHRQIRKTDFNRTSHNVYHELSKHFHENRIALDKNADSIIVDMTQHFKKGVFSKVDGAVLESFLHYRHIPYTTIDNDIIEQYSPSEPWGNLEGTVMPPAYREELYNRLFEDTQDAEQVHGDAAKGNGVTSFCSDSETGKADVYRKIALLRITVSVHIAKVERAE